jgi:hypothetical protein
MTAQPTRPAERGLLELDDTADPLPFLLPWKKDAKSEQDLISVLFDLINSNNIEYL